jgi:hypothetical protein
MLSYPSLGRVAEWSIAAVLKTAVGGSSPWVRIPPRPPRGTRSIIDHYVGVLKGKLLIIGGFDKP